VPISELVFGALTQNRSSLDPSLEFAAIAGTPRIENGGSSQTASRETVTLDETVYVVTAEPTALK
jgi:hypothetical protein